MCIWALLGNLNIKEGGGTVQGLVKIRTRLLRFHRRCCGLFSVFTLVLASGLSASLGTSVKDLLAILVHFELYNAHFGGVDTNINRCSVGLFTLNAFDVYAEFFAVTLDDLADLLAFVVATYDLDFVIFTNRHVLYSIF